MADKVWLLSADHINDFCEDRSLELIYRNFIREASIDDIWKK
jgi:hypothetical protein